MNKVSSFPSFERSPTVQSLVMHCSTTNSICCLSCAPCAWCSNIIRPPARPLASSPVWCRTVTRRRFCRHRLIWRKLICILNRLSIHRWRTKNIAKSWNIIWSAGFGCRRKIWNLGLGSSIRSVAFWPMILVSSIFFIKLYQKYYFIL